MYTRRRGSKVFYCQACRTGGLGDISRPGAEFTVRRRGVKVGRGRHCRTVVAYFHVVFASVSARYQHGSRGQVIGDTCIFAIDGTMDALLRSIR